MQRQRERESTSKVKPWVQTALELTGEGSCGHSREGRLSSVHFTGEEVSEWFSHVRSSHAQHHLRGILETAFSELSSSWFYVPLLCADGWGKERRLGCRLLRGGCKRFWKVGLRLERCLSVLCPPANRLYLMLVISVFSTTSEQYAKAVFVCFFLFGVCVCVWGGWLSFLKFQFDWCTFIYCGEFCCKEAFAVSSRDST